jgi:hypothetical protein
MFWLETRLAARIKKNSLLQVSHNLDILAETSYLLTGTVVQLYGVLFLGLLHRHQQASYLLL